MKHSTLQGALSMDSRFPVCRPVRVFKSKSIATHLQAYVRELLLADGDSKPLVCGASITAPIGLKPLLTRTRALLLVGRRHLRMSGLRGTRERTGATRAGLEERLPTLKTVSSFLFDTRSELTNPFLTAL